MILRPPSPLRRRVPLLLLALALVGASCVGADEEAVVIRIGAGSTAEQQVLAALSAEMLSREGAEVTIVSGLGDTAGVRDAALRGRIDTYWDYSGAAWTLGLDLSAPAVDAGESFEAIAAEDADIGLRWLGPSGVDASLAFFVLAGERPEGEEATLSWLAGRLGSGEGSLCADRQYLDAPAGYAYLADTYAIATDSVTTIAAPEEESVDMVASGRCLAGLATATSGAARLRGLAVLTDDQGVFPAMAAAPVVLTDGRADTERTTALLTRLAGAVDTDVLAGLNAAVTDGALIDEVAAEYLDGAGLS